MKTYNKEEIKEVVRGFNDIFKNIEIPRINKINDETIRPELFSTSTEGELYALGLKAGIESSELAFNKIIDRFCDFLDEIELE